MIEELKARVINEMEDIMEKMNNGYSPSLCDVIDKIYYIKYLSPKTINTTIVPSTIIEEPQPDYTVPCETIENIDGGSA